MSSHIKHDEVADILRDCAERFVLPRFRKLKNHEIRTKSGPTDLVTDADRDVEAELELLLPRILPGSIVVGEEGVSAGVKSLDLLSSSQGLVWVVDPVDGTYNFANGGEKFCIMLALVENGETTAGWIYDPVRKRIMIVEKGGGAFIDGQKINVAASKETAEAKGYLGMKYFPKEYRPHIKQHETKVAKLGTLACAGHEYLQLASGNVDFSVYTRVKPWDHLSGMLMVQEAGGFAAKWDRTPYLPQDRTGGILAASGPALWDEIHEIFLAGMLKPGRDNSCKISPS